MKKRPVGLPVISRMTDRKDDQTLKLNPKKIIMKTPERFDRANNKLVKAFFNDSLAKGDCTKCAVGNMCDGDSTWSYLGYTNNGVQHKGMNPSYFGFPANSSREEIVLGISTIKSTGYSMDEILEIEFAFETNTRISHDDYKEHSKSEIMEDQFNGLMAVVEVLCEIEGLDAEPYKKAFEYSQDFQPVNA